MSVIIENTNLRERYLDCSGNPDYPAATLAQEWEVTVAGLIGGVSGKAVSPGDLIKCIITNNGGNESTVGAFFILIEGNKDQADETNFGLVKRASVAEAQAGSNQSKYISPYLLTQWLGNLTSDNVQEGTVNLYFTETRVLDTLLTGLNSSSGGNLSSSDDIIQGFGKLQYRVAINDNKISAQILTLGGLSDQNQTFAVGTTGTSPAFVSATGIHTLNIPMAATALVTAGLLSNTDWNTFNNKQTALGYTPVNKAGDSMSGILYANGGIDVTATGGSDILNIGTSGADVINIGWSGAVVNIFAATYHNTVTNLAVKDALIRLNEGGGAGSAVSTGFEIEEGGSITGYFSTNGTRDGYDFKAPAIADYLTLSLSSLTAHRTLTAPNNSGTIALTSDLTAYEPALGNPGVNGYILSSTTGGVRSWIPTPSTSQWVTTGPDIYYNTGKVGIGNTVPAVQLHVAETSTNVFRGISFDQYNNGTNGSKVYLRKARGTFGTPLTVVSGDLLGNFTYSGYDGSTFIDAASIRITTVGTIGTGRVPTKIDFMTMTDVTTGVLTTALTIDQTQDIYFTNMTTGSVLYAGTSGKLTQDNNNFNFTSTRLNLATAGDFTGTDPFNIYNNGDSYAPNSANTPGTTASAAWTVSTSRGTGAVPLQNNDGDFIGSFGGWAYNGSAYVAHSSIRTYVKGATSTNRGGQLEVWTKADNGVMTQAFIVNNSQITSFNAAIQLPNAANTTTPVIYGQDSTTGIQFGTIGTNVNFVVGNSLYIQMAASGITSRTISASGTGFNLGTNASNRAWNTLYVQTISSYDVTTTDTTGINLTITSSIGNGTGVQSTAVPATVNIRTPSTAATTVAQTLATRLVIGAAPSAPTSLTQMGLWFATGSPTSSNVNMVYDGSGIYWGAVTHNFRTTGAGGNTAFQINGGGSILSGASGSTTYRLTNAGSNVTGHFLIDPVGTVSTAGALGYVFDTSNGMSFTHANGTLRVRGWSVILANLGNTAGSEFSDLQFTPQNTTDTFILNGGNFKMTNFAGTTNRFVSVDNNGNFQAIHDIITGQITNATIQGYLSNALNWTAKVYTGTAITGTYQSQWYNDGTYFFFFTADNVPVRMALV